MRRIWGPRISLLSILLPFLTFPNSGYAQNETVGADKFVPVGWEIEDKVQGDLTGDKLDDLVLALKKTGDPDSPGKLLVLTQKSDGTLELIGSNSDLMLCENCQGMAGDRQITITQKGILVVDQLAGSRDTRQDVWRFRFDTAERQMRLIGLDVEYRDRAEQSGQKESTNYLTGKRIEESYAYSEKKQASVVTKSRTTSVAVSAIFLEQVTRKAFLSNE